MSDRISVIMPFYNGSISLLQRALKSVDELHYKNKEIVLVDDGSDIGVSLVDVVSECNLTTPNTVIVHTKNLGIAAARNTAISNATGEWLIWLDCDDILEADCIDRLINEAANALMVIGECYVHEGINTFLRKPAIFFRLAQDYGKTIFDPMMLNVFSLQPQIVRKSAAIEMGLFDSKYQFAEMTEFFLRFLTHFGLEAIKTISGAYYHYNRNVPDSVSRNRDMLEQYRIKALLSYCKGNGISVDDIVYLGRSDNTGTQVYAPVRDGTRIIAPYTHLSQNSLRIGG